MKSETEKENPVVLMTMAHSTSPVIRELILAELLETHSSYLVVQDILRGQEIVVGLGQDERGQVQMNTQTKWGNDVFHPVGAKIHIERAAMSRWHVLTDGSREDKAALRLYTRAMHEMRASRSGIIGATSMQEADEIQKQTSIILDPNGR